MKSQFLLILLSVIMFSSAPSGKGKTIIVSKDGKGNFKTIQEAVNAAGAGDKVLVKEGVYNEQIQIKNSGTMGNPIIIMPYKKDSVLIDGMDKLAPNWGVLVSIQGSYIHFESFQVANSLGMGVNSSGSHNILRNLNVHHCEENGIIVIRNASYNIVENCHVWWNCKANAYGKRPRSWASGLSSARHPVSNTILRKNIVHNNWGEGLSTYESDSTIMEDNIVYDNYSTNIYISDASNVLCQRNLVYNTPNSIVTKGARVGIMLGDEKYNPPSKNIVVINNIVTNTRKNFYWWIAQPAGSMENVLIANNTFLNSTWEYSVQISAGPVTSATFVNNIVVQDDSLGTGLLTSKVTVSNNIWSKAPSDNFLSPSDIVGDPKLSREGDRLKSEYFRLTSGSSAIDKAKNVKEVTSDFFNKPRKSVPDIGAVEF